MDTHQDMKLQPARTNQRFWYNIRSGVISWLFLKEN